MKADRTLNRFAQLFAATGFTQEELAQRAGTSKQQINRYVTGVRSPNLRMAKLLAPHMAVSWHELLGSGIDLVGRASDGAAVLIQAKSTDQQPTPVEPRIVVRQKAPVFGEPLEDPDELELITFWRSLSVIKKAALFAQLGFEEMPSLRKSA